MTTTSDERMSNIMKTIVFGGTGWVGHHIVKAFHAAGHEVTICSRGLKDAYLSDIPDGL